MDATYHAHVKTLLFEYLKHLRLYLTNIHQKNDPEALHHMRIFSRRLRNVLWIYKSLFPKREIKQWQKSIRHLAQVTSQTRNLDVIIGFIKTLKIKKPSLQRGMGELMLLLEKERQEWYFVILKALNRFEKDHTLLKIEKTLKRVAFIPSVDSDKILGNKVKTRISNRLRELLDFQSFVHQPRKIKELHHMRIAAKHLRYSLESLEPQQSPKPFIASSLKIQNLLGDLHDYVVWKETVRQLTKNIKMNADLKEAVVYFKNQCDSKSRHSYRGFVKFWKVTKSQKTWEKLNHWLKKA